MRSHTVNLQGDEITYFLFFESAFVADLRSLVSRQASRFVIEAIEPCRVNLLSRSALEQLYAHHPASLAIYAAIVEAAYIEVDRRMESLLLQSAAERYRHFLARYAPQAARIPQYILASWLGIKPESLSRIRRKLGLNSFEK